MKNNRYHAIFNSTPPSRKHQLLAERCPGQAGTPRPERAPRICRQPKRNVSDARQRLTTRRPTVMWGSHIPRAQRGSSLGYKLKIKRKSVDYVKPVHLGEGSVMFFIHAKEIIWHLDHKAYSSQQCRLFLSTTLSAEQDTGLQHWH